MRKYCTQSRVTGKNNVTMSECGGRLDEGEVRGRGWGTGVFFCFQFRRRVAHAYHIIGRKNNIIID